MTIDQDTLAGLLEGVDLTDPQALLGDNGVFQQLKKAIAPKTAIVPLPGKGINGMPGRIVARLHALLPTGTLSVGSSILNLASRMPGRMATELGSKDE